MSKIFVFEAIQYSNKLNKLNKKIIYSNKLITKFDIKIKFYFK